MIFSTPLSSMTSGSKPPFALTSVAASRSLRRARRAAIKRSKVDINRNRQGAVLFQLLQGLAGDEAFLEGAISPAAHHPDVTGAQAVAQFRQHTELIIAPINAPGAKHVARPTLPDKADRRGFRQAGHGPLVHIAQRVDRAHQRRRGRHTPEDECIEESRSPT
ncbi:MAG TPA: hypothetical protein VGN43_19250, partial [Steroidobacteraceae bacterium]|nr:hypothetical protein [Steroidobacteraceae bacterium]